MRIILANVAAVMLASPTIAQTQSNSAVASAPTRDEPKICRRVEQTGSRMAGKRICHTAGEWQVIDADAERNANGGSNLRSKQN